MKKLRYMNKEELLNVYKEFDLMPPESDDDSPPTNDELRDDLQTVYDVTDQKLKEWEEKKDAELEQENESEFLLEDDQGNIVICMDRNNRSFGYGKYMFSPASRYQVVDSDTAKILLRDFDGFHRATREELKLVFNK